MITVYLKGNRSGVDMEAQGLYWMFLLGKEAGILEIDPSNQ